MYHMILWKTIITYNYWEAPSGHVDSDVGKSLPYYTNVLFSVCDIVNVLERFFDRFDSKTALICFLMCIAADHARKKHWPRFV